MKRPLKELLCLALLISSLTGQEKKNPASDVLPARKVEPGTAGVPKVAVDLQPGIYKYKATVSMGGQQMTLSFSTTIEKVPEGWTATDVTETAIGPARDMVMLEGDTLIVRKRSLEQGQSNINLDFSGNKAEGAIIRNGSGLPISADLSGPLFGDAAGAMQVIACLPLAEGYTTSFRNFDPLKQKEKIMQLKVAGIESVTVPAGTFKAYKVNVAPIDGSGDRKTFWITKDSHKAIKMSVALASMGGATLNAELAP